MPGSYPARALARDAVIRQNRLEMRVFLDWLGKENVQGINSEISWPNSKYNTEWDAWNAAGDDALRFMEEAGLEIYLWGGGTGKDPSALNFYDGSAGGINPDVNVPRSGAVTSEKYGSRTRRGVNCDGNSLLTILDPAFSGGSRFYGGTSVSLGVVGTDYTYPSQNSLNYLAGKGFTAVRLPIKWERIAHTPGGALDATEAAALDACIARIGTAGMQCVVDLHNWCTYSLWSGQTFTITPAITLNTAAQTVAVSATPADLKVNGVISVDTAGNQEFVRVTAFVAGTSITGVFTKSHAAGVTSTIQGVYRAIGDASGLLTQAHFTDVWTKLSTRYLANANVLGYDLMNEPQGMANAAAWQTASQAAVTAIRATGDVKQIQVMTYQFGVPQAVPAFHPVGWITDTASNFKYSVHYYWGQPFDPVNANFTNSYRRAIWNAELSEF